jgi:hypothetical protein
MEVSKKSAITKSLVALVLGVAAFPTALKWSGTDKYIVAPKINYSFRDDIGSVLSLAGAGVMGAAYFQYIGRKEEEI